VEHEAAEQHEQEQERHGAAARGCGPLEALRHEQHARARDAERRALRFAQHDESGNDREHECREEADEPRLPGLRVKRGDERRHERRERRHERHPRARRRFGVGRLPKGDTARLREDRRLDGATWRRVVQHADGENDVAGDRQRGGEPQGEAQRAT
jgi:hypothetical protein